MITKEEREGKTPNGGVRSEIYYQDEHGNPTDKHKAKRAWIRELDAKGNLVHETFGTINR